VIFQWMQDTIIVWLITIFNYGNRIINENDFKTKSVIDGFKIKLLYFLYENYANIIIDQFFNIIIGNLCLLNYQKY